MCDNIIRLERQTGQFTHDGDFRPKGHLPIRHRASTWSTLTCSGASPVRQLGSLASVHLLRTCPIFYSSSRHTYKICVNNLVLYNNNLPEICHHPSSSKFVRSETALAAPPSLLPSIVFFSPLRASIITRSKCNASAIQLSTCQSSKLFDLASAYDPNLSFASLGLVLISRCNPLSTGLVPALAPRFASDSHTERPVAMPPRRQPYEYYYISGQPATGTAVPLDRPCPFFPSTSAQFRPSFHRAPCWIFGVSPVNQIVKTP
ncbi:hypothetical protein EDB87DRAFT_280445 [Lactarius vividus]|nr:hypothetical protein EDB87DRAFT_280445 [Lactarius vividus]